MAWTLTPCSDYEKAKKDFAKKWPDEMRAMANNLRTVIQSLDAGASAEQLKVLGCVHGKYPLGIISVDESGHEKKSKPKALRLYLFPCEEEQVLYVMLLGDKSRQDEHVKLCKEFVSKKIAALKEASLREQKKK